MLKEGIDLMTVNKDNIYQRKSCVHLLGLMNLWFSCTLYMPWKIDVLKADKPGAFLQAYLDGILGIKIQGRMSELLMTVEIKLYRK